MYACSTLALFTKLFTSDLFDRHGHVAKFLIDRGANVNVHAKGGWTAFDVASITGVTLKYVRLNYVIFTLLPFFILLR